MRTAVIAAMAIDGGIGFEGHLPWPKFPEDMKRFKALTEGQIVIMGRRTYESIGSYPLPNRCNIVISRSPVEPMGVPNFGSLSIALRWLENTKYRDRTAFIIGGKRLFAEGLEIADEVHITQIYKDYPHDVTFPVPVMTEQLRDSRLMRTACEQGYSEALGCRYEFNDWRRLSLAERMKCRLFSIF